MNLGRKWAETEGEGKPSCEKLRVVLGVILVVAVCQNTHLDIQINAKVPKTEFRTSAIYSDPLCGRPSRVGGLPNSRSSTCGGHSMLSCRSFAYFDVSKPFLPPRPNPRTRPSQITRSRHSSFFLLLLLSSFLFLPKPGPGQGDDEEGGRTFGDHQNEVKAMERYWKPDFGMFQRSPG